MEQEEELVEDPEGKGKELEVEDNELAPSLVQTKCKGSEKGPSAYQCFCKRQRLQVKKAHPEALDAEVLKHLAHNWCKLLKTEKHKYEILSKFKRQKGV